MHNILVRLVTVAALWFVTGIGGFAAVPGRPDRTHIVFGYMQNSGDNGPLRSYRWQALTHIGYTWVAFGEDGSFQPDSLRAFQNRSPELLRGGAAQNNGVRVIAVLCNHRFRREIIDAVFTSPEKRARLVSETVKLVRDANTGCDGVSLDVEPMNFRPATAAGFNQFLIALADALHGLTPRREVSMYVGTYYPARYTVKTFSERLDYTLYSAYNFASGNLVGDVGSVDKVHSGIDSWLRAGLPPEKVVLTAALFGKQWETTKAAWGATGKPLRSIGMDYGNYLTLTRQPPLPARTSGPNRSCVWVAEPADKAGSWVISTFDDMTAHERKLGMALRWDGKVKKGSSLGGVGFWSFIWVAQGLRPGSVDPDNPDGAPNPALRRTFSPPWTLWEELFSPPARILFRAETFEGTRLDPIWAAPANGPDAQNVILASLTSIAAAAGAAPGSHRAAALQFSFSAGPGRLVCKYRPLADTRPPHPIDRNAFLVLTPANAEFVVPVFLPEAVPGTALRMVVCDGRTELEQSQPFPLKQKGWQQLRWNLADAGSVEPCVTRERGLKSGNGRIDSGGRRDIGFIGFEVESSAAAKGRIEIDGILYSLSGPR